MRSSRSPVAERPRLVFLANPDNPMGSWWTRRRGRGASPARCHDVLPCLDEAYADFAPAGSLPAIDPGEPPVLRFRTFSKAYGMAGLRVGYALRSAGGVATFDRVRNHFGVNRVGQAGALVARRRGPSPSVVARVERLSSGSRRSRRTTDCMPCRRRPLRGRRLRPRRRIRTGGAGGPRRTRRVYPHAGRAPLDRCIRISTAPDDELDVLAAELPTTLAAADRPQWIRRSTSSAFDPHRLLPLPGVQQAEVVRAGRTPLTLPSINS